MKAYLILILPQLIALGAVARVEDDARARVVEASFVPPNFALFR